MQRCGACTDLRFLRSRTDPPKKTGTRPQGRGPKTLQPPKHTGDTYAVFWFIPTHGDSRYLGTAKGGRQLSHDYLKQVAVAADSLGYEGVLIPTGRSCEDPWVVAASLLPVTRNLKFLVAVRPGLHQPALAARMAATFDRLSGGRLLINLVTGGDQAELEGDGVFLDHATRYEQSAEFIRI